MASGERNRVSFRALPHCKQIGRIPISGQDTVPVTRQKVAFVVLLSGRGNLSPTSPARPSDHHYTERQGKEDFQKYVAEPKRTAQSGRPDSGRAQIIIDLESRPVKRGTSHFAQNRNFSLCADTLAIGLDTGEQKG